MLLNLKIIETDIKIKKFKNNSSTKKNFSFQLLSSSGSFGYILFHDGREFVFHQVHPPTFCFEQTESVAAYAVESHDDEVGEYTFPEVHAHFRTTVHNHPELVAVEACHVFHFPHRFQVHHSHVGLKHLRCLRLPWCTFGVYKFISRHNDASNVLLSTKTTVTLYIFNPNGPSFL